MITVWANSPDVPINVCANARYDGADPTKGQAGWDIGIGFMNLTDLADQLYRLAFVRQRVSVCTNPIKLCSINKIELISRLAINAHGAPGQLRMAGNAGTPLTAKNIVAYRTQLHKIGLATSNKATIFLMGCIAGKGAEGTELLTELQKIWPGRKIVAFVSIGYQAGGEMKRPGEYCSEPGMRDTRMVYASDGPDLAHRTYGPRWKNLEDLPWASETSPGAKIIQDGVIIRDPIWDTKGNVQGP